MTNNNSVWGPNFARNFAQGMNHIAQQQATPQTPPSPTPPTPPPGSGLFTPTNEWQEVPPGAVLPNGCVIRMDLASGKQYATWDRGIDTPAFQPANNKRGWNPDRATAQALQNGPRIKEPQTAPSSAPDPAKLQEIKADHQFRGTPPWLLRLAATPTTPDTRESHSQFTRDTAAWKLAWGCHQANVGIDIAHALMDYLFDGMAQPERDTYSSKEAHAKVTRAYKQDWTSYPGDEPYAHKGPWDARLEPFRLPTPEMGDPNRIEELWAAGFPVLPIPLGFKGGHGGPLWEHLYGKAGHPNIGGLPKEEDWRVWRQPRFQNGNTAILWGHGNLEHKTRRLYDIEVEYRDAFEAHQARDYFLQSTPCYLSKKSVHIIVTSDEIVRGHKAKGLEFRGHGSYSLIPASEHPDSTDANPIAYRWYDPSVETILHVSSLPAFVHHYFPELFTKDFPPDPAQTKTSAGAKTPTADEAEESLRDLSRRGRLARREAALYGARNFVAGAQALAGLDRNPDFSVRSPEIPYTKLGVLFGPEASRLSQGALSDLLAQGMWKKQTERVDDCASPMHGFCWKDGDFPDFKTISSCGNICHTCMTETARRIGADLLLPNLEGGNRYRVIRLVRLYPTQGVDEAELKAEITNEFNDVADILSRLGDRKRYKPLVQGRGLSFYLDRPESAFHLSVVLQESEDDPGAGDAFIQDLLATRLDLKIWGEVAFQKGDDLAIQLMEMTYCHLMGMKDSTDEELFSAFFAFSKGRHLFQAMHSLYKAIAALQRREPLLCPVCQRPLRWRIDSHPSAVPTKPPSPPPPKQARFAV